MKKTLLVIYLTISFSIYAQGTEIDENADSENEISEETSVGATVDYDKTGLILSLSAFNYFSIGLGFNRGEWWRAGPHFGGYNYGLLVEYKTIKELHLRIYGNIYGGVSAMYLGASAILCTNFEEFTGGLAPEIGLGVPGFSIFYRYNFYFYKWDKYNCHEIVLLVYPVNKLFNRKR